MNKHIVIFTLISIIYLLVAPSISYADGIKEYGSYGSKKHCNVIYGGGKICEEGKLIINKTVQNPQTNEYIDSLFLSDPKFDPQQVINFRIYIQNIGTTPLSQIDIKDIFPAYVNFTSGPGKFDQNTRTLSFTVASLKPSESMTLNIAGTVQSANQLPKEQGVICVSNQAIAYIGNSSIDDNAQFCIRNFIIPAENTTKGGLTVYPPSKVKSTPATGPEALPLLFLLPSGLLGVFLRKRTNH